MHAVHEYKLDLGDLVWSTDKKLYGIVTDINKFSNKCEITWIGEKKRPRTSHRRWVDPDVSNFKRVSE